MPTNLPPEYFEIERQFKASNTSVEKINQLKRLLSVIPKHKGTDKLRAEWRKRLSKLKAESTSKKKGVKKDTGYIFSKEGGGQIAVIGPPNTGKSTLVSTLTNASPEISPAPRSTWKPTPGMVDVYDIQLQLIDTPSLVSDYVDSQLIQLIRRADLCLLVVDITEDPFSQTDESLNILIENKICPYFLSKRYEDFPGFRFMPFILCINKNDAEVSDGDVRAFVELWDQNWKIVAISAEFQRNLDTLKKALFQRLDIIRVYAKTPGRDIDYSSPFVLPRGGTVEDFAAKIHGDLAKKFKSAKIWGEGVYDGQMVQRDHILKDKNIVEVRL